MIVKILLYVISVFVACTTHTSYSHFDKQLSATEEACIHNIILSGDHKKLDDWLRNGGSLEHRFKLPGAKKLHNKKFPLICIMARYIGSDKKYLTCLQVICDHILSKKQLYLINGVDDAGCTALHILVDTVRYYPHNTVFNAIKILLSHGASCDIPSGKKKKTAHERLNDLISEEKK